MLRSRRDLLKTAAFSAAAIPLGSAVFAADPSPELLTPAAAAAPAGKDLYRGLKVGVASYSFRKFPLEQAIADIKRLDLHYVSIKDVHLPLNSTKEMRQQVAAQFREAGINPISCGNITIKNEANARQAFEYARDISAPVIVCYPDIEMLPTLDKLVKEFDIKIAIHNHGPEVKFFQSPIQAWDAIQGLDPRIGLCIDVGHTARAKVDPVEAIRKCQTRLFDCHFKDINDANAKSGSIAELEVGRGILDIRGMLAALLEIKFAGHVGFEHEKTAANPLPGLAESVGFTRGVLSYMG